MKFTPPYKNANITQISQKFSSSHEAIDFAPYNGYGIWLVAPENVIITKIVDSDEVSESLDGMKRGYGIKMTGQETGCVHLYWHCLPVFPVEKGQRILAGQPVSQMGNSGLCYRQGVEVPIEDKLKGEKAGTHCHYEVFQNGVRIDFLKYINWETDKFYSKLDQIKIIISLLIKLFGLLGKNKNQKVVD